MKIKDYIRAVSVKVLVNGKVNGTGTVLKVGSEYYVLTAAHVIFGKKFESISQITPDQVSMRFDDGVIVEGAKYCGDPSDWKKYDLVTISISKNESFYAPVVHFASFVAMSDLEFIFRGVPKVADENFKFYEGFKFDDYKNGDSNRITIHGDMKYLTDFNGIGGSEFNSGVSGCGVFVNIDFAPFMVAVVTDVPYPSGAFGTFEAALLEPIKLILGFVYEDSKLNKQKYPTRIPNSPIYYHVDEALKQLLAEHEIEKQRDVEYRQFSEELNKYFGKSIRDNMRSLDEKLEAGGRSYLIDYALEAKESVTKKIHRLAHYMSAQEVYTYLLTNIHAAFIHEVSSKIKSGQFHNHQIDDIVKEHIIDPYLCNLNGSSLQITKHELYGILYFLTGNCYIEWD